MTPSTKFKELARRIRNRAVVTLANLPGMRSRNIGRLAILTYHRVLPLDHPARQDEEPGIIVTPELFALHMSWLKSSYNLVRLDDWLANPESFADQKSIAVTFDDGWQDNYDFALEALREHQVPATIFLVPAMIGKSRQFWPGVIMRTLRTTEYLALPSSILESVTYYANSNNIALPNEDLSVRSRVIAHLKSSFTDQLLNATCGQFSSDDDAADCLSDTSALELYNDPLISIGSHTYNHTRLNPQTPLQEQQTAILQGHEALNDLDNYSNIFCYPNGDQSDYADGIVRSVHRAAATVEPGWNQPDDDFFKLRRYNLHDGNSGSREALQYLLCTS